MANWAYTSYVIEGPKEVLQKIEQAILHHPVSEGADEHWEGDVLNALGCKWVSRDDDREKGKYMRGFINEKPWWADEDYAVLRFDAEEAWGATDFNEVLKENFPEIKVFYSVEEQGEGVFFTNDKEGKYFPDRFYVDTCIDGNYQSEYFVYESSMYKWLHDITEGRVNNAKDAEQFNSEHEDLADDDENFISIYEFTVGN